MKSIKIKGPREPQSPGISPKILPGRRDLTILKICLRVRLPKGDGNAWN